MRILTQIVIIAALCSIVVGCAQSSAPKIAFEKFNSTIKEGNWSGVWDMLSARTRKAFEEEGYKKMKDIIENMPPDLKKEKIEELGLSNEDLLKLNAKEFFVLIMEKTDASKEFVEHSGNDEVEKVNIKNNVAKLKIKNKNEVATMVLEDGSWKIEFEEE